MGRLTVASSQSLALSLSSLVDERALALSSYAFPQGKVNR